jgi:WD40 repeat protein
MQRLRQSPRVMEIEFAEDYFGPDHGGRLLLWDLEAEELIQEFTGHHLAVQDVALSGDCKLLLSASSDKTVNYGQSLRGTMPAHFSGAFMCWKICW